MATRSGTLTLASLIAGLAGIQPASGAVPRAGATRIRAAVIDSRLVTPGSLFVALRGERRDGHDYIPQAIENGAVAVIAERAPQAAHCTAVERGNLRICSYEDAVCLIVPDSLSALQKAAAHWRRQHSARVIGITGSVGKTTSKEVIAAVLGERYRTLKSQGNYNNEIGLPLTLLHLTAAHERVVLEMGMYDLGEITQLAEIAMPQVGVLTNIGPTHLERLGTIERIAQAKAELPRALPSAEEGGIAILNADDKWIRPMAAQTSARVFTYGLDPSADLWADDVQSEGLEGVRFRFHHGQEILHARVSMLGRHSVHTALSAAATGLVEGLSWEEIMAGLHDRSAQLRLVAVPGPAGSIILDDTYNASPASSMAALNLLDELDGHKIAVLGDMYELGHYEEEGHKLVGRRVRDVADLLITVGRLGGIIGEEALKAGMDPAAVHFAGTNVQAIDLLRAFIEAGPGNGRVLVKGSRGLEMEEIVAALTHSPRPDPPRAKDGRP
jgi:UDP-N-acetylmuramoyl-tripeptide--D-alanyl-D-alanine ligase